jgi:hypothetical protein
MSMASRSARLVIGIVLFVAVSFGVHYALFGALPVGKPALLADEG